MNNKEESKIESSSSPLKRSSDLDSESERPEKILKSGSEMNQKNRNLQRYLLAVEYIGTKFHGSQQQPNYRTVVGTLEEAFHKFIGQPVSIFCSSRTDAGVHALSNVCHVDVERISKRKPNQVLTPHEPLVVRRAVNHFLQKYEGDIMVTDVRFVPSDFHARFMAKERTYYYRVISGPDNLSTFDKDRVWHVSEDLDIISIKKACNVLIGHHDFSSFRASGCQANSPMRTLDELTITETSTCFPSDLEPSRRLEFGQRVRQRCFVITARARSFLYHQVRLMVGVLKCVGSGELTINDVEKILEAKNVTHASPMAPACGLYLAHVKYDLDLP